MSTPTENPNNGIGPAMGPPRREASPNASIRAIAGSLMEEDEDHCTFCIGKKRIWAQQNPDGKVSPPEENLEYPVHGWPELARLMAQNADLQAFPAFTDLSVKSLLYYQAELTMLREKLHELKWKDHLHGDFKFSDKFCQRVDFLFRSEKLGERAGK